MKQPNQALAFLLEREKTAGKKYFTLINKKSTHNECFFSRKFFNQNLNVVVTTAPNMSSSLSASTSEPPKIAGVISIESLGLNE